MDANESLGPVAATHFRVLLAEDDPVSRAFLAEGIRACGADLTDCGDGDAALRFARAQAFDLLILDHHLPGRNGDAVLAALRGGSDAASRSAPAIATSAARDVEAAALLQVGFVEVLPKPMALDTLRDALRRHGCTADSPLDDKGALRACGSTGLVTRLRRLFLEQDLPRVQEELDGADRDPQSLRPLLHRLQASCGFCGARRLASATATLQHALATDVDLPSTRTALQDFRDALAETRASLHAAMEEADA
ncbi:MAG TPA: response regulator [Rhodanobacteraceae bacterium]|nr:response regulator [Rhodanobacteraceae bacterium]